MKSGRGQPRREKGPRRPRRSPRERSERRPRREAPDPDAAVADVAAAAEEAMAAPPPASEDDNPVPSDMSEEEFMRQKLEELRRRFQ